MSEIEKIDGKKMATIVHQAFVDMVLENLKKGIKKGITQKQADDYYARQTKKM